MRHEQVNESVPDTPDLSRALLMAQFQLYRGIVSKKHGVAVWIPADPAGLSGPELEQWVTFLRDAAHLPPG